MKILDWLNNQSRWSDLGHGLVGFFAMTLSKGLIGIEMSFLLFIILIGIKEFVLDKHKLKEGIVKSSYYIAGLALAAYL